MRGGKSLVRPLMRLGITYTNTSSHTDTHTHSVSARFAWNVGAQTRSPCGVTNNVRMRTLLNRRLAGAFVVCCIPWHCAQSGVERQA